MGCIFNSYPCDLVSLYWFLSGDIFLIRDLLPDEMVNLESPPQGWHLLDVNLTRLAPDLGQARQKYICMIPS